jgi:hypothetical protein
MPAAQALGIFKSFQEKLVSNVKTSSEEPVAKKQKKSAHSSSSNNSISSSLITVYFVEFTNALKLNQHQLRTFEEPAMSVFEDFVKPVITRYTESKGDIDAIILPALQMHSTLISIFFEIYFLKINAKDQEWLSKSYIQIFQDNNKNNTLGSRLLVATSVCYI